MYSLFSLCIIDSQVPGFQAWAGKEQLSFGLPEDQITQSKGLKEDEVSDQCIIVNEINHTEVKYCIASLE